MTTALEIITGAARLLGVIRKGEALGGDEAEDGFVALNDMIYSWSNDGLLNPARIRESFTLTAGQSEYTISTTYISADFDSNIPNKIISAFIRSANIDYPLEIITDDQYEMIALKSTQSSPGWLLNYSRGEGLNPDTLFSDDWGTIRLYPVPSSGDELHILSEKLPFYYQTLNSENTLPPGWLRALRYNLALEMAPEFGVEPSALVVDNARKSLGAIKLAVAKNRKISFSNEVMVGDFYTGYR